MANNTFKASYSVLQQHAQTLRTQKEPNIDDLLTIVTESVCAYKVCQERIDAVERALEKALSDTSTPSFMPKAAVRVVTTSEPPESLPCDPDDVPF
jgi:exodeoxyribonuclease VII small subunit